MASASPLNHFSHTQSQLLASHNIVFLLTGLHLCTPQEALRISLPISDSQTFMTTQIVPYEA